METASPHHGELLFCQSCGMPMPEASLQGSDREGNKIEDYCIYCYESGEFKQPDITLQEMTDLCAGYMIEEAARSMLAETLPRLKRWSTVAAEK